jgi:HSP20 family protein
MATEEKMEISTAEKGKEIRKPVPARAMSPFDEMDRMMERMIEGVFPRGWVRPWQQEWPAWSRLPAPFEGRLPTVDVIDRENEVVVRAEVPGVEKKDLDVSVAEDTVTIKGSTRREEKEEKGDYHRREIVSGSFARTVTLPAVVDTAKAKASFKDGILELTLPKIEKARKRKVDIE